MKTKHTVGGAAPGCKNCHSGDVVKNGKVRGRQRYTCKGCGYNFVEGDARTNEGIAATKALCVLLYSLAKGSYNMLGRIFGRDRSLVYRWIREAGLRLAAPDPGGQISEIGVGEMRHFVESRKASFDSSRRLIAAHGRLSCGCPVLVILQPSEGCTGR
jgi:transposase